MKNIVLVAASLGIVASACGGRVSIDAGSGGSAGSGGASVSGDASSGGGAGDFDSPLHWAACGAGACVLVESECCVSGCDPVSLREFDAVNPQYEAAYRKSLAARCAKLGTYCPMVRCAAPGPGEANRPNFVASCQQGLCTPIDVRTSELSECKADADCYLRRGANCCEACDPSGENLVAVRTEANLCEAGPTPCPGCPTSGYPSGARAACDTKSGHCYVAWGL